MNELEKYKHQNPFTVPEGFFDSFRDEVMEAVRRDEKRRLFRKRVALISSAAAVVVIALMVSFFWKTAPTDNLMADATPVKPQVEVTAPVSVSPEEAVEEVVADPEPVAVAEPAAELPATPKQVRVNRNRAPMMARTTAPAKVEAEKNVEITSTIVREYEEELEQELYCDALLDLELYLDLCYEY